MLSLDSRECGLTSDYIKVKYIYQGPNWMSGLELEVILVSALNLFVRVIQRK